jgi:hypothetical protein
MYYGLLSLAGKTASGYDSDVQTFFTAAGITDTTQKSAVNQLVLDLKSAGIWTKMKAIYPFVGGTATSHSYNLKNSAQYQITWSGGLTHSSTGVLPNGVNGYGSIAFNFNTSSSGLNYQNNHLSFYSRTNASTPNAPDIGGAANSNQGVVLQSRNPYSNSAMYATPAGGSIVSAPTADSLGYYLATTLPSTAKLFKNNTLLNSASQTGGDFTGTSGSVTIFGVFWGYSARESSFASFGDGLTDAEASALYTAVQAFQTTLSRNV